MELTDIVILDEGIMLTIDEKIEGKLGRVSRCNVKVSWEQLTKLVSAMKDRRSEKP
jgi:hypothetical protein